MSAGSIADISGHSCHKPTWRRLFDHLVGALRIRTVATKDRPCADFPYRAGDEYDPSVLLDLDYWALIPR